MVVTLYTRLPVTTLLLIACCLTILVGRGAVADEQSPWPMKVKAAIDNAPPYRIITEEGATGIYVEIYEIIVQQLNVETEYLEVPFPRALHTLKSGDADIMLGPVYNQERATYLNYSLPAFPPVEKVFLVKHKSNEITAYADLSDKVIAVQRGSSYFRKFDNDEQLNKVPLNDYAQALCMLDAKRVDVVIIPEPIAKILLNSLELAFFRSPLYVPGDVSYIAISNQSPLHHHADRLRQALDKIKASPEYQQIFERFLYWDAGIEARCTFGE